MLILSTKLSPSKFNKSCWITLIVLLHTSFLGGPRSKLKLFLFDVENFCIYLIDIKPHFDVHKQHFTIHHHSNGLAFGKKPFFLNASPFLSFLMDVSNGALIFFTSTTYFYSHHLPKKQKVETFFLLFDFHIILLLCETIFDLVKYFHDNPFA